MDVRTAYYDNFVTTISRLLNSIGINIAPGKIFLFVYNFVPAFIFGPILFYKGRQYEDKFLQISGILLLIFDSYHFYRGYKQIQG